MEGGDLQMSKTHFPQEARKFEIQAYQKPTRLKEMKKTHVAFSGSPMKHPGDLRKVILVTDPYSSHTFYYEFLSEDISFVEELPSVVDRDGKAVTMVRIWVKKMSLGVLCSPFIVAETSK
jgi:hypothetical protein